MDGGQENFVRLHRVIPASQAQCAANEAIHDNKVHVRRLLGVKNTLIRKTRNVYKMVSIVGLNVWFSVFHQV